MILKNSSLLLLAVAAAAAMPTASSGAPSSLQFKVRNEPVLSNQIPNRRIFVEEGRPAKEEPETTNTAPLPSLLQREESSSSGLLRMSIGSVSVMDWGLQSGHSRCSFNSRRSIPQLEAATTTTNNNADHNNNIDMPSKPQRVESGFSIASMDTLPDDEFQELEASCSSRSSSSPRRVRGGGGGGSSGVPPKRIDSCASTRSSRMSSCFSIQEIMDFSE